MDPDEPTTLKEALGEIRRDLQGLKTHRGSRYVGAGADPEFAEHVAKGGTLDTFKSAGEERERIARPRGDRGGKSLAQTITDIKLGRTEGMRSVYDSKALAELTDTAGGFLLEPEISDQIMMLVRNRAALLKLPVTEVKPTSKRYDIPGLSGGGSVQWVPENAALPAGAETFQIAAQLYPHGLGGLVAISNRLLQDASNTNPWSAGSVEDVIRRDIADLFATTLDSGLIAGATNGPTVPLLNVTGTTAQTGVTIPANGYSITGGTNTYGLLVAIVNALRQANFTLEDGAWLFPPRVLQGLESLMNSYGEPLLASAGLLKIDPKDGTSGTLMGFPFQTTNNVPTNLTYGTSNNATAIVFGKWSEMFVGTWTDMAIDVSGEASYTPDGGTTWISAYQSQQTLTRCTGWFDGTVRRPSAFVVQKGILP